MSSSDQIIYRRAATHDIETLVDLRCTFLEELATAHPNDPNLRDSLKRYFSEAVPRGEYIGFLAEVDEQVIATNGLVFHRYPPSARNLQGVEGYVMNVYTRPEWRGRGIAARLLSELVATAREAKCTRLCLKAVSKAAPIYLRANFVAIHDLMQLDLV